MIMLHNNYVAWFAPDNISRLIATFINYYLGECMRGLGLDCIYAALIVQLGIRTIYSDFQSLPAGRVFLEERRDLAGCLGYRS